MITTKVSKDDLQTSKLAILNENKTLFESTIGSKTILYFHLFCIAIYVS
jgi:hypothetical protein